MSDDPFQRLTRIEFYRREKAEQDYRGWVVQANPTIGILWVAALLALVGTGLLFILFPPAACVTGALVPLLLVASAAYYYWDERTFRMQIRPDGFQVHDDRVRWADIEGLEATKIYVAGLGGTELQISACGLVIRRSGYEQVCFPTLAPLEAVEEVAHQLEQLRLRETGALPEDAARVAALTSRSEPEVSG